VTVTGTAVGLGQAVARGAAAWEADDRRLRVLGLTSWQVDPRTARRRGSLAIAPAGAGKRPLRHPDRPRLGRSQYSAFSRRLGVVDAASIPPPALGGLVLGVVTVLGISLGAAMVLARSTRSAASFRGE